MRPRTTAARPLLVAMLCLLPCAGPPPAAAHGDFHDRVARADRAVEAEPRAPEPLLRRAELYRRHGEPERALADVERARDVAPDRASSDYYRGLALLDLKRNAEAEQALRRFLVAEPGHAAGHEALARALTAQQRHLDAARSYDAAIAAAVRPAPDAYLARAESLARAGDAHLDEAVRGLDDGMRALGPLPALERAAVDLELRRGDPDAALRRIERAAGASGRPESWLVRGGEVLEEAGRPQEARAAYARAVAHIDALSAHRRGAPAVARLERRARDGLTRVAEVPR